MAGDSRAGAVDSTKRGGGRQAVSIVLTIVIGFVFTRIGHRGTPVLRMGVCT